jgi:DNA-binding NtrC family response regulator
VLQPGAIHQLASYDWPGNVRELENVVERALILAKCNPVVFDQLIPSCMEQAEAPTFLPQKNERRSLDEVVSDHIRYTLAQTKDKIYGQGGAAELLRINPSTLRSKIKKLGIKYK